MISFRPISISLSPNTEKDDIQLVLRVLFHPWRWKNGEEIVSFERDFQKYLGVQHAISFNSGRSAFLAILKSLDLEEGDEILLQAFTCNAVPNPILWAHSTSSGQAGLKPVYVDCDEETFNLDLEDLQKKITK